MNVGQSRDFSRVDHASVATLLSRPAAAEIDFKGKTVTIVMGTQAGDGTDTAARLMGRMMTKYLPGNPTMLYRNLPAGHGIQALNYFNDQVRPDGLSWFGGSGSSIRPETLRRKEVRFDPRNFHMFGGLPAPGGLVVIRKDAMPRLYDRTAQPVIMGDVDGNRASGQLGLWGPAFLGWNMKYVVGYAGTGAMTMAFKGGETHAYVTYNSFLLNPMRDSGDYVFLAQVGFPKGDGFVARPDYPDVPVLSNSEAQTLGLELKLKDGRPWWWPNVCPAAQNARRYRGGLPASPRPPSGSGPTISRRSDTAVYSTTNGEKTDRMVAHLADISDDVLDYIKCSSRS
jgi:hypothetical protein